MSIQPSHFLQNIGSQYLRQEVELEIDSDHKKPGVDFTAFTRENSKAYVFDYPLELQQILKDTFQDPKKHGYNASTGIQGLREAVADLYSTPLHKVSANDVVITSGIEMSHLYVLYSLTDEGENFIVPPNTYRKIEDFPASLKIDVKKASLEEISAKKDDKTKFLYISNPNEPNGKYEYDVNAYKEKANEIGVPLVLNEEMISLPFSGDSGFRSTTSLLGKESAILMNSSDCLMLAPGFRIGFLVFYDPQKMFGHIMEGIEKIAQMFLHPSIPLQFATVEILKSPSLPVYMKKAQAYFQEASAELHKHVGQVPNVAIHDPEYGLFAAIELKGKNAETKFDVVKDLLAKQNILVQTSEVNGHVAFKISLTNKLEDYSELGERLKEFLN